jgi:hypothetical protein
MATNCVLAVILDLATADGYEPWLMDRSKLSSADHTNYVFSTVTPDWPVSKPPGKGRLAC